jgi:fluoride exporter
MRGRPTTDRGERPRAGSGSVEVRRGGASGRTRLPPRRAVLAVAAGGAVGGSLRYGLLLAAPVEAGAFPLVILLENLTGAFLLGLVLALIGGRWRPSAERRAFLTTGVLGSFTTFSNVTLDVATLAAAGRLGAAIGYLAASTVLGLAAAMAGLRLGRAATRRPR